MDSTEDARGTTAPVLMRLCQEMERSYLFGGRLCWSRVAYLCAQCGKGICPAHARLDDETTICASCAATAR